MKQKILKAITVFLCALLALVLLLTMLLPAFAAETEQGLFTFDDGDSGALATLDDAAVAEALAGLKMLVKLYSIPEDDEYGIFAAFSEDEKFANKKILAVYANEIYLNDVYEADGYSYPIGSPIVPSAYGEDVVQYLPGGDEYRRYEGMSVAVYEYSSSSIEDISHKITKIDGKRYVEVETELWSYIILYCDVDGAGAPIGLPFYRIGALGFLYEIRLGLLVALIGVALLILFCHKPKSRPSQDAEAEVSTEAAEVPSETAETPAETEKAQKKKTGKKTAEAAETPVETEKAQKKKTGKKAAETDAAKEQL